MLMCEGPATEARGRVTQFSALLVFTVTFSCDLRKNRYERPRPPPPWGRARGATSDKGCVASPESSRRACATVRSPFEGAQPHADAVFFRKKKIPAVTIDHAAAALHIPDLPRAAAAHSGARFNEARRARLGYTSTRVLTHAAPPACNFTTSQTCRAPATCAPTWTAPSQTFQQPSVATPARHAAAALLILTLNMPPWHTQRSATPARHAATRCYLMPV